MNIELISKEDLLKVESKLDQVIHWVQTVSPGSLKIYSTEELAEKLQVSTKTIQNWREQRLIEYSQVNNKIFYTEKSVLDFLSSHSIKRFNSGKINLNF
jgi:hypothetical protein